MNQDESVGATLRKHRTTAGLNQDHVAALAGVDAGTIGRIERNESEPSVRTLRRLSQIFGLSMEDLAARRTVGAKEDLRRQLGIWSAFAWIREDGLYGILRDSADNNLVRTLFAELDSRAKEARDHNDGIRRIRRNREAEIGAMIAESQKIADPDEGREKSAAAMQAQRDFERQCENSLSFRNIEIDAIPAAQGLLSPGQMRLLHWIVNGGGAQDDWRTLVKSLAASLED